MEEELLNYYQVGLSSDEVAKRVAKKQVNGISKPVSKSYRQILKDNVFTLFNLLNFLIFIALLSVKAWTNLVFMFVIVGNAVIGIIQEIKAKHLVDQLSILTKPVITVVRDQKEIEIKIEDVVIDDILVLESGNQVCNDAVVIKGTIDANESLLTGEVDPVNKELGAHLLSGSSVISGKCYARVVNVGEKNYATSLVKEAKQVKEKHSELLVSMEKVTKVTTFMIIPLGIILFLEALLLRQETIFTTIVSTSAGLLGMLPKGLVLLTSVSLANGVTRLAKKQVLVQDLYSLETLAHVDVLCLDKTGTITDGKMKVEDVVLFDQEANLNQIMGAYLKESDDNNATFKAMQDYFKDSTSDEVVSKIPFSSLRKWGAVEFTNLDTIVVGAIEKIIPGNLPPELTRQLDSGMRVIGVGTTSAQISETKLPKLKPLAAIILSDTIRHHTKETLAYFHEEGIATKIISGDNINTVKAIARSAGVPNYKQCVDMSTIAADDLEKIVLANTIFARVTPKQKKAIVDVLKKHGKKVAMTGDGVNDLLALKEADCSIAIGDGSDASKQISQVVLLNNDFTCLPDVLLEGRKVVNNVTRVAGIFFIKTIYTILLTILCVFSNTQFPFIPLQITLIDLLIEAFPAFLTMFEANTRKIDYKFLPRVLGAATSSALSITILFIVTIFCTPLLKISSLQQVTIMYLLIAIISMVAVIRSCYPFTKLRTIICCLMVVGFLGAIMILPQLFNLAILDMSLVFIVIILGIAGIVIERIIHQITCRFNF